MVVTVLLSILLKDHVDLEVVKNATLPFPSTVLTSAALFFLRASVWTITQQICQCTNSRSNICLLSIVERAWHCFTLDQAQFQILYPTKKRNWLLGIHKPSLMCSCRHKQLFCVALHLLWVLLISSWFALVIYAETVDRIQNIDCRPSWGCLLSHWVGLMFNRLLFG